MFFELGFCQSIHTSYYDYRPHLQPFNYNLLHDEEGMHVYILFSIPMKVNFFWSKRGKIAKTTTKGAREDLHVLSSRVDGSIEVSGKLPTYPYPKSTLSVTSNLGKNVGLGEG